ncbi:hypothetical protein MRX96_056122 [Rhipicephalus microplus]
MPARAEKLLVMSAVLGSTEKRCGQPRDLSYTFSSANSSLRRRDGTDCLREVFSHGGVACVMALTCVLMDYSEKRRWFRGLKRGAGLSRNVFERKMTSGEEVLLRNLAN